MQEQLRQLAQALRESAKTAEQVDKVKAAQVVTAAVGLTHLKRYIGR